MIIASYSVYPGGFFRFWVPFILDSCMVSVVVLSIVVPFVSENCLESRNCKEQSLVVSIYTHSRNWITKIVFDKLCIINSQSWFGIIGKVGVDIVSGDGATSGIVIQVSYK